MFDWLKKKKTEPVVEPVIDPLEPYRDIIAANGMPTIAIRVGEKDRFARSYFGGMPVMESAEDWPVDVNLKEKRHFLAQIDLAQVREEVGEVAALLPPHGVFQIFVNIDPCEDGLNGRTFTFRYLPELSGKPISGPALPKDAYALSFQVAKTWPQYIERLGLDIPKAATDAYEPEDSDVTHRLLGYPSEIQDELIYDLQQMVPDSTYEDWVLLLQIDSDDKLNTSWNDSGSFYFFIDREALEEHDYSEVRMCFQCY